MSKAKVSKKHHVVPEGILKNFCYETTKFFYFSKRRKNEGVASRDISKKFYRMNYYSVKDELGKYSDELERDFLQKLDSRSAEFATHVLRLLDSGNIPVITKNTHDFICQFIYYLQKRSPDFQSTISNEQKVRSMVETAILDYEEIFGPVSSEYKDSMSKDEYIEAVGNLGRVQAIARQSPDVLGRLEGMDLSFAVAEEKSSFIIGSFPVVRLENKTAAALGEGDVQLWVPISPRYAVGLTGPAPANQKIGLLIGLNQAQVRKINSAIFRQSSEVASLSERLLKSVVFSKYDSLN